MDLFNQPPLFDLITMEEDIKSMEFENPYLQVVWDDVAENFTQERIRSVKQYFSKKYSTLNVNIITKTRHTQEVNHTVDVSMNIMDKNYQRELMRGFLVSRGNGDYFDEIVGIDDVVDNKLSQGDTDVNPFQKWYIKKIHFSNFLSFGENQTLDFEKCNGITVVESDPPNFGGKTVLTVDLLLFLFFNTTTKTQKAEEIFNRFRNDDKVSVRGEVSIDGDDYVISRTIERKLSKKGEWNVKTDLDFLKKLADGTYQNFVGEQRRETEKFIKNSIGEMDDFLMTILTTASNLEELIDAKPTARGQVLSRFMGLEFLKRKEDAAKEVVSEFTRGMLSNVYSTENLKQEIEDAEQTINTTLLDNEKTTGELKEVDERLETGQDFKDGLLNAKHMDIDQELVKLNPLNVKSDITNLEAEKERIETQIKAMVVKEPSSYYHEDQHDKIRREISDKNIEKSMLQIQIEDIESLVKSLEGGVKCEHCGIELIDAELNKAKIAKKDKLILKLENVSAELLVLEGKERLFTQLKKDFDEYEKNKLIKEKLEVSHEAQILKIERVKDTLKRYEESQEKIKSNHEIDAKLIKAQLRIDELINKKREFERKLSQNTNVISNATDKIARNRDLIQKIKIEFEQEKFYKIYLEIFGKNGIGKIIMKTMMPIINQELQYLLQDSSYFNLEIRINDKNDVEFIMTDNSTGIEKLMASGSGYERTIASMALRSVLTKICSLPKPNVVIMDEVFGKISNDNLELVGEFFVKIKQYFEKIFVITHNPLVSNWADNLVKIKKEENISKVYQD
jgi:DNA repair exonuclease SbcCD ATPase subunit